MGVLCQKCTTSTLVSVTRSGHSNMIRTFFRAYVLFTKSVCVGMCVFEPSSPQAVSRRSCAGTRYLINVSSGQCTQTRLEVNNIDSMLNAQAYLVNDSYVLTLKDPLRFFFLNSSFIYSGQVRRIFSPVHRFDKKKIIIFFKKLIVGTILSGFWHLFPFFCVVLISHVSVGML